VKWLHKESHSMDSFDHSIFSNIVILHFYPLLRKHKLSCYGCKWSFPLKGCEKNIWYLRIDSQMYTKGLEKARGRVVWFGLQLAE